MHTSKAICRIYKFATNDLSSLMHASAAREIASSLDGFHVPARELHNMAFLSFLGSGI